MATFQASIAAAGGTFTFPATTSTGGPDVLDLRAAYTNFALEVSPSTLSTGFEVNLQGAIASSAGPWSNLGSTALVSDSTTLVQSTATVPVRWVRPNVISLESTAQSVTNTISFS